MCGLFCSRVTDERGKASGGEGFLGSLKGRAIGNN